MTDEKKNLINQPVKASDIIIDAGFEDVIIFSDPSYDTALIGVTIDNEAVYE